MDCTGPTDQYKTSIILVWSLFYTECYILRTWSAKYCIRCVILALSVLWIIVGMVAHVQSLVHYTSCCMCDSDKSVLKMLSTNAAQPIFSARNEAIGWEKLMIFCSLNINIYVAIHHQLNLELEKVFYSQLQKPAKEVSL